MQWVMQHGKQDFSDEFMKNEAIEFVQSLRNSDSSSHTSMASLDTILELVDSKDNESKPKENVNTNKTLMYIQV